MRSCGERSSPRGHLRKAWKVGRGQQLCAQGPGEVRGQLLLTLAQSKLL